MNNHDIAQMLRNVAAAYEILGENRFRINAYAQAADSIDVLPTDLKSLWEQNRLSEVGGIGGTIAGYLTELFTTGRVAHFEEVYKKMPEGMFDLMKIRTIGPKTAVKLASELKLLEYKGTTIYDRLQDALNKHAIQELAGFGEKREEDIRRALTEFRQGQRKKKRMLISEAHTIAEHVRTYLQKDPNVTRIDALGSLRRKKETIGDIDMAVVTRVPVKTVEYFVNYPERKTIVDQGLAGGTIITKAGVQVDLRVAEEKSYGAMLQYFTGSKYHNIRLREYALSQGYSLAEHGIKKVGQEKRKLFSSEEEFYQFLKLDWIPPEIREDRGEVQRAIDHTLPHLVELADIRGDLHIHSNYDLTSSHDIGASPLEELLKEAHTRGYEYIGLADHNPKSHGLKENEVIAIMKTRKEYFDHLLYDKKVAQKYDKIKKVYIMLEIDIRPNGELALPEKAFDSVDAVLVSIHSSFTQDKETMTKRILKGLAAHPKVRVFAHPTGRLINTRNSIEAHWDQVFDFCHRNSIALEVNASPNRLDLPDLLVWEGIRKGLKFVIGTDSHVHHAMDNMQFGVSVARRGWATKRDILNTLSFEEFDKWLNGRISK